MVTALPDPETLSRTVKILIDNGAPSFEEAQRTLASWTIQLSLGPEIALLPAQIAALTAATTAKRAAGRVSVAIASHAEAPCAVPGLSHLTVRSALQSLGVVVLDQAELDAANPTIVIGRAEGPASGIRIQLTWDGWVAAVRTDGTRLGESGGMPLAPAAAAALAVNEAFGYLRSTPDHGFRNRHLSLWKPDAPLLEALKDNGPELSYLPNGVWFVGLGHLGQAYAWCWRLLPYPDPAACTVFLQDAQPVSKANESTGVLVNKNDLGRLKTRLVDEVLRRAGFSTRLIERNLLPGQTVAPDEPDLALLGVDDIEPRRSITDIGWTFAIDVGLGSGPTDFSSIALKSFTPHDNSKQVPAWSLSPRNPSVGAIHAAAYQAAIAGEADQCGVLMLADRAAAASFIGVLGACLAIAEPLRYLHGGGTSVSLAYDAARPAAPRRLRRTDEPRLSWIRLPDAKATLRKTVFS